MSGLASASTDRWASALYFGSVRHRRHAPFEHSFRFPLFLVYLDLDEAERLFARRWFWSVNRPALAWLRRRDYFGDPSVPLIECARDLVERETGRRPTGPVRLLTHLRMFGHAFNPVSFYYCFDEGGERLVAVLAEVTSTPWKERHVYVLDVARAERIGGALRFRSGKALHVSPFLPMNLDHLWTLTLPGRRLVVQVDDRTGDGRPFDATLTLARREIDARSLAFALARFPLLTVQVVAAIYYQAFRLWLKGATFHPHPKLAAAEPNAEGPAQ